MTKARKKLKLKLNKNKNIETNSINLITILDSNHKLARVKSLITDGIDYNKVKYRDNIYKVGDVLIIREPTEGYLIGRLVKIHTTNGSKKYVYWPTIEVEW